MCSTSELGLNRQYSDLGPELGGIGQLQRSGSDAEASIPDTTRKS